MLEHEIALSAAACDETWLEHRNQRRMARFAESLEREVDLSNMRQNGHHLYVVQVREGTTVFAHVVCMGCQHHIVVEANASGDEVNVVVLNVQATDRPAEDSRLARAVAAAMEVV